jgi:signal transduction histidine kinase
MNFFNSEERKRQKELDRKIKIKEGRRRLERYIQKQQENLLKYRKLAKRAQRVGDEPMFRQIVLFILRTQRDITQWERRILYFDMVEARKDQVLAAAEFAKAYEVMAQSMLANSNPASIAKIQHDIETGLMRAEMMDDMLENLMDVSGDLLSEPSSAEDASDLKQMMDELTTEAEQEAQGVSNAEIEASLRAIEEQLRRS